MAVKLSQVLWPKKTSDKSADTFTSAEHLPVRRTTHHTHAHTGQMCVSHSPKCNVFVQNMFMQYRVAECLQHKVMVYLQHTLHLQPALLCPAHIYGIPGILS